MALTAPGLSTACSHDASTAYWRRRGRQPIQPLQGPRGTGMTLRTPRGKEAPAGGKPGPENRTGSLRPLREAIQRKRSEDPLNDSACLMRAATREGRRGDPPLSSAPLPLRAATGWRGSHLPGSGQPHQEARKKRRGEQPPSSNARSPRTTCGRGRGGGDTSQT